MFPELSPVGRFDSPKVTESPFSVLVTLKSTLPETFSSFRPDKDTIVIAGPWVVIAFCSREMGISSASAFPLESVASTTMGFGLWTGAPE